MARNPLKSLFQGLTRHFFGKGVMNVPYSRVADLPDSIQGLPMDAQKMWMNAYNQTWATARDEKKALSQAWGSVEGRFERSGDRWIAKLSQLPLLWSDSTVEKLQQLGYNSLEQDRSVVTSGFGKDPNYMWVTSGLVDQDFKPETLQSFPLQGREGTHVIVGELMDRISEEDIAYNFGVMGLAFDKNTWPVSKIEGTLYGTSFADSFIDEGVAPTVDPTGIPVDGEVVGAVTAAEAPAISVEPSQDDLGLTEATAQPTSEPSQAVAKRNTILKMADEEQTVTSIVMEPDEIDTQGDMIDADEIHKAQRRFTENYLKGQATLGLQHTDFTKPFILVENYLAPVDFTMDTPRGVEKIKKGTWIATMKVLDPNTWARVKKGELTGFSIGGSAIRDPLI